MGILLKASNRSSVRPWGRLWRTAVGDRGQGTHLQCQAVVPLQQLVPALGAVGEGAVHLQHAGVAGGEGGRQPLQHAAAEGSAVHALAEVQPLGHYCSVQGPAKVAGAEGVFSEHQLHEFDFFHA